MTSSSQPQLAASYIPGRDGNIDVPELLSPAPQRVISEFPSNMQDKIAYFELQHNQSRNSRALSTDVSLISPPLEQPNPRQNLESKSTWAGYEHTNESIYYHIINKYRQPQRNEPVKFNPFPRTENLDPSIPLSDEEKGDLLERVRYYILKLQDPEVQLAWAQDALLWVDIQSEFAISTTPEGFPVRSIIPERERQLCEDAVNIVKHLEEQGHPKANFIKAYWLEFGKFGYGIDKIESFLGYTRAAEKGFARAHYRIGMQYENSNNPMKAVEHYRRGIIMHDSASHYRLGMMVLLGQHGIPLDYGRAVNLLRFAAETADENSPQGAYVYGMLLARDLPNINIPEKILPYDIKEAKKMVQKAAYLGFGKAQAKMGLAYELCQLGCEFDPTLSLHYNALASRQREADADMAISKWFLCGYEGLFEKNEELAFIHAHRAASTGLPMAEFAMGYFYEIGMFVSKDLNLSEMWYKRAAEHGNTDALERIESIRENNTLSRKYHEQIAVNRIKSRYGSQRGGKPDRFKKSQSMPTVERGESNLPNVNNSTEGSITVKKDLTCAPSSQVTSTRPGFYESRNTYPGPACAEEKSPKDLSENVIGSPRTSVSNKRNQPISIAPYPLDENDFAGYAESSYRQTDRPQSAFGIRVPITHKKNETDFRGDPKNQYIQVRPSSSMGNIHSHGDRASSVGGRIISTGNQYQHPEYRSSVPHTKNLQGRPYDYVPNASTLNRKPITSPITNKSSSHYWDDFNSRPSVHTNDLSNPRRHSPIHYPVRSDWKGSTHPQVQQNINRPRQRQTQQNIAPPPAPKVALDSRTNSRPLPSTPLNSSTINSPPKKTGPVTFEEMGIPAANKEFECSVM